MLKEDREIEQGAFGCAAIVLFAVLALVVSIAVGVFFGAGFWAYRLCRVRPVRAHLRYARVHEGWQVAWAASMRFAAL